MPQNQTYLLLSLATIFWGIQPLCIKILIASWTPASLTCLRYLLISLILFLIMYLRHEKKFIPPKNCIIPLLLMGLTGIAINNVSQFTGLKYSTITNCTLIAATGPAVTAMLSAVFIRERLKLLQWIGIIISFIGVIFLITKGSWEILANFQFNPGDILFFTCQIVWAAYSIIGLRVMKHLSAIAVTAWSGLLGSIEVALFALCTGQLGYVNLDIAGWSSFVFVVLCGGVGSMLFWNIGVKNAGPSMAAIFSNLTPIFGMLCGAIFLSEEIGIMQISGALAIFVGVYITTHSEQLKMALHKK
ncbi:DMT family transporter [Megamonas hypermegale]|uniref:DMT family transporter n=1 Tax=Megamonas hypermegale TaxID=158847 RepID=A0A921L879_9FIRM|nr:DMT family transporter [Megamonas hypermegale]MDM8144051.1 DMT family transporter [Megamonas hypermegale]HJF85665.1 DMT family transporter [Megamonas hypermegale]